MPSPVGVQSRPSAVDGPSRLRSVLDDQLRPWPTKNQAQRGAARWACVEALTQALILDDGSFDVSAIGGVRDALQPGSIAALALGATGARHVLLRLRQLEADASSLKRIEDLAKTKTIDPAVLPFVLTHAKRGAAHELTPRDIGMIVLGALFDTVRQRNAGNCAIVAERIDVHESSPHEVLDTIGLMLHKGLTEVEDPEYGCVRAEPCEVPVDDPLAWKARLRVGPLPLMTLLDVCPGALPLADLLSISHVQLAELFTRTALKLAKPGQRIRVGDLIELAVEDHCMADPGASIRSIVDKMRNTMAAREGNLLLASWAMTLPVFVQRDQNSRLLAAAEGAMRATCPDEGIDEILSAFSSKFHSDVRHILSTERQGRRRVIPSVRACAGGPRVDAIGPESFRAAVFEVLLRAVSSMVPEPAAKTAKAVAEYVREGRFIQDVTKLFQDGDLESTDVPWELRGRILVATMPSLRPRLNGILFFSLRVKLRNAGWVKIDFAHPPPRLRQVAKATLAGWIEMMRTLRGHPHHAGNLPRDLSTGTLVVSSHGHSYRLLPTHLSWADAWMETDRPPGEWIEHEVVQPAKERGRKRYRTEDVRRILAGLLENITLNDGISRASVVEAVLRSCTSRRLPDGDSEYRLDRAVRQMSRELRGAQSTGGRALSPRRDVRKRLCAAVQMLPETHGGMVVYGDTNWRTDRVPSIVPSEPLLFGIAYDMVTQKLRRYVVIEGQGALAAPLQWCKLYDFKALMPG